MAWTYSDWDTKSTDAERLTSLRLYIKEIEDWMEETFQSQGAAGQEAGRFNHWQSVLDRLEKNKARLEEMTAGGSHLVQAVPRCDYNGS